MEVWKVAVITVGSCVACSCATAWLVARGRPASWATLQKFLPHGSAPELNAHNRLEIVNSLPTQNARNPFDPSPRQEYLSWDDYFMSLAFLSAQRSKDPNKQVGACIVSEDNVILGIGYNGFPRGCHDSHLPWSKKAEDGDILKTKHPYVVHAEANALLNKNLASVSGAKIYVTMFPCNECAKLLIQAGVKEVVFFEDKANTSSGGTETRAMYLASLKLLKMADVKLRQHQLQRQLCIPPL